MHKELWQENILEDSQRVKVTTCLYLGPRSTMQGA